MEAGPLDDQSVAGLRNIVQELIGRVQALENERYLIQNTICTLNSNGNTHGRMNFNEKIVEKISWGNDSHIMAPEKGMILNNDKTVLTISTLVYTTLSSTLWGKTRKLSSTATYSQERSLTKIALWSILLCLWAAMRRYVLWWSKNLHQRLRIRGCVFVYCQYMQPCRNETDCGFGSFPLHMRTLPFLLVNPRA